MMSTPERGTDQTPWGETEKRLLPAGKIQKEFIDEAAFELCLKDG